VSSIIYGPVASWRLGKSLGIDLLSTKGKTCCFDCVYCQLGRTSYSLIDRREFVSIKRLAEELESVKGLDIDYVTFSGMGEPTLASNLGRAIELVKSVLPFPVAVLTNSAFMDEKEVRQELALADTVVAKLDAPNEELLREINRPASNLRLKDIVSGISKFRHEYRGRLVLQIMFIAANMHYAGGLARMAGSVSPDEVELNTPLRPCAVPPLPPQDMEVIEGQFARLKVVNVYKSPKPEVQPLDIKETLKRRPKL
jgi:wyosine [tRNA(Phe)-imidazoG37] synthetase (radical SAM superfamily)